ncbi:MAG: hypothetical protein U0132_20720 [Gemmatimonadaceae bacterium]
MNTSKARGASTYSALGTLVFLAAAAVATACGSSTSEPNDGLTPQQRQGVAQVKSATSAFQTFSASQQAGYTHQFPVGCAQSAEGAQGFHYLNDGLVDGQVDLLHPELVMYEPQADGTMRLIGVDYIVPFDQWTSPTAPTLLGMPFMRNEPLGVWALHIWAFRTNPTGMFAMWNPNASCQNAN